MRHLSLTHRLAAAACIASMALVPVLAQESGRPVSVSKSAVTDYAARCPRCEVEVAAMHELERRLDAVRSDIGWKFADIDSDRADIQEQKGQVAKADRAANSQVGTGGSGFDPSTGLTTHSVTQSDGRVKIWVTNEDGDTVGEPTFRNRKDVDAAKAKLEKEKKELSDLEKKLSDDIKALKTLQAKEQKTMELLGEARGRVAACEEKCELAGHSTAYKVGLIAAAVGVAVATTYALKKGGSMPSIPGVTTPTAQTPTTPTPTPQTPAPQPETPTPPPAQTVTPPANPLDTFRGNHTLTGEQVSNTGCSVANSTMRADFVVQGMAGSNTATFVLAANPIVTFTGTVSANGAVDMLTRASISGNSINVRLLGTIANGVLTGRLEYSFSPTASQCGGAVVAYAITVR